MKKYSALLLLSIIGLLCAMGSGAQNLTAATQTYKLEISFVGADIRLEIKDAAKWAPAGELIALTSESGNAQYTFSVQQPSLHLTSVDRKTPVTVFLTLDVQSSSDNLSLDVETDNFVLIKCLQSNDAVVVKKGQGGLHKLRLR